MSTHQKIKSYFNNVMNNVINVNNVMNRSFNDVINVTP